MPDGAYTKVRVVGYDLLLERSIPKRKRRQLVATAAADGAVPSKGASNVYTLQEAVAVANGRGYEGNIVDAHCSAPRHDGHAADLEVDVDCEHDDGGDGIEQSAPEERSEAPPLPSPRQHQHSVEHSKQPTKVSHKKKPKASVLSASVAIRERAKAMRRWGKRNKSPSPVPPKPKRRYVRAAAKLAAEKEAAALDDGAALDVADDAMVSAEQALPDPMCDYDADADADVSDAVPLLSLWLAAGAGDMAFYRYVSISMIAATLAVCARRLQRTLCTCVGAVKREKII